MNRIVLSTRLHIPKPRKNFIVREALFEQLKRLPDKRLMLIKGAPGSGKTTLLTSYRAMNPLPLRWVTLDSECNEISLFWQYVLAALSGLTDLSTKEFATFLQTNALVGINESLKVLINALDTIQEIYLVLDDFHLIHDKMLINSIEFFLNNMPAHCHVVLLTREQPPLYLSGFEMKDEILFINEHDLLLSKDESMAFLTHSLGLSLADDVAEALIKKADGWIGGLQLLAASYAGKGRHLPSAPSVTLINDYIRAEIFNNLTENERHFLAVTAMPAYFNKDLAAYLMPDMDFDNLVAGLFRKNLMVQLADEELGLYKYHNLLRDFLLAEYLKLESITKEQLYRKACRIFQDKNDYEECLRLLFLLEDYERIMEIILTLPHTATHFTYMAKVPVTQAAGNFDFALQKFFYHYYVYEFDVCNDLYREALTYRTADSRYNAFVGAAVLFNEDAFAFDEKPVSIDVVRQMEANVLTKALVLTKNAAFQLYQDQFPDALLSINASIAYEKVRPGTYIHYYNLTLRAQICEEMGLLNEALSVQKEINTLFEENKLLKRLHMPTFHITLAGLYMKQMRMEKAHDLLATCKVEVANRGGQIKTPYEYNLTEYFFLTGNTREAEKRLMRLLDLEPYKELFMAASLLRHLFCAGAMNHELQNRFISAYENSDESARNLNSRLLYALLLFANNNDKKALAVLDESLGIARKQSSRLKIIEANLLKLEILMKSAKEQRLLLDLMKEALYYAYENDLYLPFNMASQSVIRFNQRYGANLLSQLSPQELTFYHNIVDLTTPGGTTLLSIRELEILQAMAEGMTNNQIVENLHISLSTVKTHIANIFNKLEVNSRIKAVEKGRQLQLL